MEASLASCELESESPKDPYRIVATPRDVLASTVLNSDNLRLGVPGVYREEDSGQGGARCFNWHGGLARRSLDCGNAQVVVGVGGKVQVRRRMLKSKIHRATVTGADLNYVGSVSIDSELLVAADIMENEQVTVLDVNNGARFETYAITGKSGEVCLNGAAARLVHVGDTVILLTYADYDEEELRTYAPRVVHVGENNRALIP